MNPWRGFNEKENKWKEKIDVREFIQANYIPYLGNEDFLESATLRTQKLNLKFEKFKDLENERGGVLDIDTDTISSLLTYSAGYIDRENEIIVGLQTNRPLRRGINPFGGIRMAQQACSAYGYELSDKIKEIFSYRSTHNDGVYRVYNDEMRAVRRSGVITGLPDAYGRGRVIGDYRRIALYGVDKLIQEKSNDRIKLSKEEMNSDNIRLAEELYKQLNFLNKLKEMAKIYGVNISKSAKNATQAIQWLYFGYLAAIKEQNGAAMSLGRVSTFIDIYIQRDINEGVLSENQAQEIIDDFVLKLRMARQLRTPDYNELFAGDPMWITEVIGGMGEDNRTLVTKTSYRMLNTLNTLNPAPEPNLTIAWSKDLPQTFKEYCAKISINTDSIQYENDDIMRPIYGDDYGIACCVSAMRLGKESQFFGARCNLAKVLLMALNGGRDEISNSQVGPKMKPLDDGYLDYETVLKRFNIYQKWLCELYVNTMNIIHYMHDKYAYEKIQMALHDSDVNRSMAFGIAGLSVVADSLSAIKHTKVKGYKNKDGLFDRFEIEGEYPAFGNDDDRVDMIAKKLVDDFISELRCYPTYRDAKHTLSILTITSNVIYGKKTGATPDGRVKGEPFAPGANPMHNRDKHGALASLNSVAKIPYESCQDGISNTFSITPKTLGTDIRQRKENLVDILDGYFIQKGHHLNVNVMNKEMLIDAMENPTAYPNLTVRVSGYAVNFNRLSKSQQLEVIQRTYHTGL